MFNTPTLAENAAGSLAVTVPGTLAVRSPRSGCLAAWPPPSRTGTGAAPGRWCWISDFSSRRLFHRGRVAGGSVLEPKHLDVAFVHGVTILRRISWGPAWVWGRS